MAITVIAVATAAVFLLANPVKTLKPPDTASVLSMDMEQFNEGASLGPVVVTDSGDSRYVAVYREARIYGECFVVDADTGTAIDLPDIETVSAHLDASAQPAANRPDPFFKAAEWVNDTTIRVNYRWTSQEGEKEVSGTYDCNIISGDILANTSQISDSSG